MGRTRKAGRRKRAGWPVAVVSGCTVLGCRGVAAESPLPHDPGPRTTVVQRDANPADRVPFGPELREADLRFVRDVLRDSYAHLELKRSQWGVDLDTEFERHREPLRRADSWSDYERVMVSFVSSFHDGHLRWKRKRRPGETPYRYARLGFETRYLQGRLFVADVWPHSHAGRLGLRVGDEIVAVDGTTVPELFATYQATRSWSRVERAVYLFERSWPTLRLVEGEEPKPRRITHRRDGDGYRTVLVPPESALAGEPSPSAIVLREVHGQYLLRVGNLALRRPEVLSHMQAVRDTIYRRPLPLVVDLRGNPGGYDNAARVVAGSFTSRAVLGARRRMRLSPRVLAVRPEWRALRSDPERPGWSTLQDFRAEALASTDYPAPLVVLIDAGCNSSCESLALLFRALGAHLWGESTAGSSGGPIHVELPHSGAELSVPVWSLEDPQGRPLEGRGVVPDGLLTPGWHDIHSRSDRVLIEAQLWLRAHGTPPGRVAEQSSTPARSTSSPTSTLPAANSAARIDLEGAAPLTPSTDRTGP